MGIKKFLDNRLNELQTIGQLSLYLVLGIVLGAWIVLYEITLGMGKLYDIVTGSFTPQDIVETNYVDIVIGKTTEGSWFSSGLMAILTGLSLFILIVAGYYLIVRYAKHVRTNEKKEKEKKLERYRAQLRVFEDDITQEEVIKDDPLVQDIIREYRVEVKYLEEELEKPA